jgi:transposase-like protein
MNLKSKIYTDETAARKHLERLQWPGGKPICPHCGTVDAATKLKGKSTRTGVYWCNACQKPFSVTVGTLFERSHIPLNKWLLAVELLCSSKKGFSSHQLHRMLGVTYKTAWFMSHRIREAMRPVGEPPLGGEGKIIEADEVYTGHRKGKPRGPAKFKSGEGWTRKRAKPNQRKIVALVERDGRARSFHVKNVNHKTVRDILVRNADRKSHLMTDEAPVYKSTGEEFASHESVEHGAYEYVRGDVHTNTIEGFFSIFRRGLIGTFQHMSEQHLQRYLQEFDFRYSNRAALGVDDNARAIKVLEGIKEKRLTYRRTHKTANA